MTTTAIGAKETRRAKVRPSHPQNADFQGGFAFYLSSPKHSRCERCKHLQNMALLQFPRELGSLQIEECRRFAPRSGVPAANYRSNVAGSLTSRREAGTRVVPRRESFQYIAQPAERAEH